MLLYIGNDIWFAGLFTWQMSKNVVDMRLFICHILLCWLIRIQASILMKIVPIFRAPLFGICLWICNGQYYPFSLKTMINYIMTTCPNCGFKLFEQLSCVFEKNSFLAVFDSAVKAEAYSKALG